MEKYIQSTIQNNLRSIIFPLTRPQQKTVQEVVRGLFTEGTPVLRHLAQDSTKTAKKQGERYSYHLGNISITDEVDALAVRKVRPDMRKHTVIAYDLTDINKECAKKMEKIARVFDGSKRKTAPGYLLHGVGINGILMKLQVHNGEVHTTNQIRLNIVRHLSGQLDKKGIWVFDRGNDDKQFFKNLHQDLNVRFIARVKENRHVVLKETGVYMSVKNLKQGKYRVYLLDEHNYKVDTNSEYPLIIRKHLKNAEPIRLLTNLPLDRFSGKQIVTMYLERWGVENVFKRVKTKFQMEKIRVLSFEKFQNIIALIQFAVIVSTALFITIQKSTNAVIIALIGVYHLFLQSKSLSFNVDSFITFMQNILSPLIFRPRKPPSQYSLFSQKCLRRIEG